MHGIWDGVMSSYNIQAELLRQLGQRVITIMASPSLLLSALRQVYLLIICIM